MREMKVGIDVNMDELVANFDGYSGADITNVCRDASFMAMRKLISGLNKQQIKDLNLGVLLEWRLLTSPQMKWIDP